MFETALLESLTGANLLPSAIVPANFNPILDLGVTFPSGLAPHHGSIARVSEVKEQPKISICNPPTSSNLTYTFMMIDPDAPTPDDPKFAYWRHWVVTSIPPSSVTASPEDITASGTTLTQYLAPGPKDESGPHRYLFLLFEEKEGGGLEKTDVGGEEFVDRRSFRAEEVVERKGMKLVGLQWMRGVGDGWKGDKVDVSSTPPKPAAEKALDDRLSVNQQTTDKIAQVNVDGQEVPALIITPGTAGKIERALCLGRTHRLVSLKAIEQKKNIDIEIRGNTASLEVLEYDAGIKKATMGQNYNEAQLEELTLVNHEIHNRYAKQAAWQEDKQKIDSEVKKAKEEWEAAWAAVEEVLDLVWTEAKVLKPHDDPVEDENDDVTASLPDPHPEFGHQYGYSSEESDPSSRLNENGAEDANGTGSQHGGPELDPPSAEHEELSGEQSTIHPIINTDNARAFHHWRQFPDGASDQNIIWSKRSSPAHLTDWEQEYVNREERTVSYTSSTLLPPQRPVPRVNRTPDSDEEETGFRWIHRSRRNEATPQNPSGPAQSNNVNAEPTQAGPSAQQHSQSIQGQASSSTSSKRKRAEDESPQQRKSARTTVSETPSNESAEPNPRRRARIPDIFSSPYSIPR
ncbi:hypothetical protein PTNB85_08613 [Pyrenophora teres f. teres]|nr:hypothetical protein PTNB85_08613 [Pyrenophora teres f. teres]